MWVLLASVCCSVAVSVLLKVARRHSIAVDQAIAVNYAMAAALTVVLLRPDPSTLLRPTASWLVLLALGVLLPTIFLAMAAAVRVAGIVLSDAAQRLSLLIPLIASFVLFGETASGGKLAGIALALVALVFLLIRPGTRNPALHAGWQPTGLLLAVWIGYGSIDVLFKHLAAAGLAFSNSLLITFSLSGLLLAAYLISQHTRWTGRSMAAGLLLGLLNFGNIYFYLRAHQQFSQNPTLVFAAMNIGVISMGALIGAGVFREKLSRLNLAGVALAIIAVLALMPR